MKWLCLFLTFAFQVAFAQVSEQAAVTPVTPESESTVVGAKAQNEADVPLNLEANKKASASEGIAGKVIYSLAILLILGAGLIYGVKRYSIPKNSKSQAQIKVISQHHFGPKKSLALVRVAGESVLIGITDHNINMLKSMSLLDEDVPEDMPQNFEKTLDRQTREEAPETEDFAISGIREAVQKKIQKHEVFPVKWLNRLSILALTAGVLLMASSAFAQVTLPSVNLGFKTTDNPNEIVNAIKIVLMLTVLTLAPAILIMMTGFTRIIIVLSFLRQALGVQQMPPNQLLVGLSLFLTFFVMGPAFTEINTNGIQPFLAGKISQDQAVDRSLAPLRKFMFNQTRDSDLGLFVKLSKIERPKTRADVPTIALVPAFILSELKTAFQIGFIIFLPFLVIDIIASSVLMAMGMMMLPPIVISLPFKIMLFVLVDGWALIVGSMVKSFG